MPTLLITGVAGFIGSHLLAHALKHGYRVVGVDNLLTGKLENIDDAIRSISADDDQYQAYRKNLDFHIDDIRDKNAMIRYAEGVKAILHQAAIGSVPWSIDDPFLTHETNLTGFLNVLNAAKIHRLQRIVYASSSAVYGDAPAPSAKEGFEGNALSPYAASKRAQEIYAQAWARSYDLQIIGLRYFNVFGSRQNPDGAYAAVIPKWIRALKNGQPCTIYGDGFATRDYCHVQNVVHANFLALQANPTTAPFSETFNIGCGQQTSLNDLYTEITAFLKTHTAISMTPPQYHPQRPGDIPFSCADIQSAKQYLGYTPIVSVKDGLRQLLNETFSKS